MVDPNRALFEAVVRLLRPVLDDLVFIVGGCTTGLSLTDPAAGGVRPTKDVDAIVEVTSYPKFAALAERLRALGLAEDTTPGAPLCRWRRAEMIVDVMPTDASVLGFSNQWYPAAIETGQVHAIAGHAVRMRRTAKTADDQRHDCEDRRFNNATRTVVRTRDSRLHVLPTKHCHVCSAAGDRGNHRISA